MSEKDNNPKVEFSSEELEDVRYAIMAHAKKWNRTGGGACVIFQIFLNSLADQVETIKKTSN